MLPPTLTAVTPLPHLRFMLTYETGETKLFDAAPYAIGSSFGRLKEAGYLQPIQLLPGGAGIECPEDQDIAPHELYENSVHI